MSTTIDKVRKTLLNLLYSVDYLGNLESGTYLTLNIQAIDVTGMMKNGVALVKDVDYTFKRPDTIALTLAGDNEEYFAYCYTGCEDSELTELIEHAVEIVDDKLFNYKQPSSTVRDKWETWLTCALYLTSYGAGSEESMLKADYYNNMADNSLNAWIKNSAQDTPIKEHSGKNFVSKV